MTALRTIPRGEHGHALGDHHHRVRVTDEQVQQMRDQHERGMGWRRIAKMFPDCKPETVKSIVYYRRRNVIPTSYTKEPQP